MKSSLIIGDVFFSPMPFVKSPKLCPSCLSKLILVKPKALKPKGVQKQIFMTHKFSRYASNCFSSPTFKQPSQRARLKGVKYGDSCLPVVAKKELNRGDKSLRNCRRPSNMNAKNLRFTHKICSRHGFLQGSVSKNVSLDLMQTQVRCCTHAHNAVRLEITA